MRKHIKKYLIPHKDNDHKPHLLRPIGALSAALVLLLLFGLSAAHVAFLKRNINFLATVVPSVLVDLANADRSTAQVGVLTMNETLAEAARLKAEHMATNSYFAHVSPDGVTPWQWFYEAGYPFVYAGENLAINFVDSADVERAWMNSPGHRANILNENFTEIGIATAEGVYEGRQTIFIVQFFGSPAVVHAEEIGEDTQLVQLTSEGPTSPEEIVDDVSVASAQSETKLLEETFIAVADVNATPEERVIQENVITAESRSTISQRIVTQPNTLLRGIYLILGLIVALVLLLTVFIKVRHQHTDSIVYGALLITLIVALLYLNTALVAPNLLIL